MPRFYLTTPPQSVTYVLNLLCILCPEPAPALPLAAEVTTALLLERSAGLQMGVNFSDLMKGALKP